MEKYLEIYKELIIARESKNVENIKYVIFKLIEDYVNNKSAYFFDSNNIFNHENNRGLLNELLIILNINDVDNVLKLFDNNIQEFILKIFEKHEIFEYSLMNVLHKNTILEVKNILLYSLNFLNFDNIYYIKNIDDILYKLSSALKICEVENSKEIINSIIYSIKNRNRNDFEENLENVISVLGKL